MSAMAQLDSANRDQRLLQAGVLALLVHVAFFIFMTFGLNWKTYPPEGVVVDLWSSLPRPAQPPTQKAKPLPPKPVQPPKKVKPLPPKPEKLATPKKPDIALKKEKIKKQQKDKEQKARVAAEVKRLQKEQQEEERKLQQKAAGAQAAVKKNLTDEYKAKILAKIKSHIVMPPDLPENPVAEFDITLLPGGEILDVKLRTSSGFTTFDLAVERAIVLSRPLPLPPDPLLFPNFRNLSLKVHYLE